MVNELKIPVTIVLVISFPDSKTGNSQNRAVFTGSVANKAHSFYVRNINRCPSVEFFKINSEDTKFTVDEELEIRKFLHRLEE